MQTVLQPTKKGAGESKYRKSRKYFFCKVFYFDAFCIADLYARSSLFESVIKGMLPAETENFFSISKNFP